MSVTSHVARAAKKCRGEQGNIIVVVILTVAVVLFGVAFAIRATGDLENSRIVTNVNAARQQALAGLSDALFRLDQQGGSPSSFCVGPSPCTVSSVPGAPNVQYTVRVPNNSTNATVLSEGTVHGRSYTIQATVAEVLSFPFGIFAGSNATFDGTGSQITIAKTDTSGNSTGQADVGSDGTITCHGSGSDGQNQVTFDGGNSNCPSWLNESNSYTPQQPWGPPPTYSCPSPVSVTPPPQPCMPTSPSSILASPACPSNGAFSGTIEPGVYSCTGSLSFSGTVNVDYSSSVNGGRVQIFLWPDDKGQVSINMSGATVNNYDTTAGTCNGAGSFQCGDPTALQVYAKGSGPITVGNGSNAATFDGILYAPGMAMTVHGGQLLWIGQFTVNQVVVDGNPNFSVHYDARLGGVAQPTWQVQNFTVVPPSTFSLP